LTSNTTEEIKTFSLDLGCGSRPQNPFKLTQVYGIDIIPLADPSIKTADLNVEPIPFDDNFFDAVSAFDFIEHVPRILYAPERKFPFVVLMSEISRVLKVGGKFLSFTPAYPNPAAFRDPTHVNIITEETFPFYFDNRNAHAKIYGYEGSLVIVDQHWEGINLVTIMEKV